MTLSFSAPVQLDVPPAAKSVRWASQSPFDRSEIWLSKDEHDTGTSVNGDVYFQRRVDGTWLDEETIYSGLQYATPESIMAVDPSGRVMILYRDRNTNQIKTAWRNPNTRIWLTETLQSSTTVVSRIMGLEARMEGGFVACVMVTGAGEAEEDAHPHLWEWDPEAESWGSVIELPSIVPDAGSNVTAFGCSIGINRADKVYHIIASISVVSPYKYELYHMMHDPVSRVTTAWDKLLTTAYPTQLYDAQVQGGYTSGVVHVVTVRNIESDPTNSRVLHWYRTEGGAWATQVVVNQYTLRSAAQPTIHVDTNDDCYVVFTEYDGSKMAVYVNRRDGQNGVWDGPVKVAQSTSASSNAWDYTYTTSVDPYWPGIVRPPLGRPLTTLGVMWGSRYSAFSWAVYYAEAEIRAANDEDLAFQDGSGGFIANHDVRMFDGVIGGGWSKWKGKDV